MQLAALDRRATRGERSHQQASNSVRSFTAAPPRRDDTPKWKTRDSPSRVIATRQPGMPFAL
jgi:hypothetical protein